MAHFSKLDENNVVTLTEVVHNNDAPTEEVGIQFLKDLYQQPNGVWKQTSYNTKAGIHYAEAYTVQSEDQSKAFRKNFGTIGYTYDESRDAFIPPKPFPSFTLNETSCTWEAPSPNPGATANGEPDECALYVWNEETLSWILDE